MKNKLKFVALSAILLIAAPAFAQKFSKAVMNKAQARVESLSQAVTLDDASKQKALDATCVLLSTATSLANQKKANEITEDDWSAAVKKNVNDYWKQIETLIPKDQMEAFKEWRKQSAAGQNAAPAPTE